MGGTRASQLHLITTSARAGLNRQLSSAPAFGALCDMVIGARYVPNLGSNILLVRSWLWAGMGSIMAYLCSQPEPPVARLPPAKVGRFFHGPGRSQARIAIARRSA
jgi:hypothetical protein